MKNETQTTTTQHTPGPWILDYDKGSTQDILSRKHGGICTVRRAGRHDNTTFAANARLIAAAPELLAALKKMELVFRNVPSSMMADIARGHARASIAKAEGNA